MIIRSIFLKEGFNERIIEFSKNVNLIYSGTNSCGKTTLLRAILYGLGYSIPNTKKIKFENCVIKLIIYCEKLGILELERLDKHTLELTINNERKETYSLPAEEQNLHQFIFQIDNIDIVNNLLGTFYIDQEKGWTLLNRGKVIGNNKFSIESLLRGLSNKDCVDLLNKESKLKKEIHKYENVLNFVKYKESLYSKFSNSVDSYDDVLETEIIKLCIEEKRLKKEIRRIDNILLENNKLRQYILDMKLVVKCPDNTTILITDDNLYGLSDNLDLLITKKKILTSKKNYVIKRKKELERERNLRIEEGSYNQIENFDRQIFNIKINVNTVNLMDKLAILRKELKDVETRINIITKTDNIDATIPMFKVLKKYLIELEIGNEDNIHLPYLFTSNLKVLSGAVLHKTAFAFRLAYITIIKEKLHLNLPIMLDSPSGKEIDQKNIDKMMNILKRDFSDHQIIIASISKYNFDEINIITIKDYLINNSN